MKIRKAKPEPKTGPKVKVIAVEDASPMVTFDTPDQPLQTAAGGFARLRPPEDHTPEQTASWAAQARAIAKAVRVLPVRRADVLPPTSTRVDATPETAPGTIREEVYTLLGELGDFELHAVVEQIMSEVDR